MNGDGALRGLGSTCGDDAGLQKPWKQVKLLFVSSDTEEITRTVKYLLRAGVRCEVRKERWNSCFGVWVQDQDDFPRALRIYMDCSRCHPLPHRAEVLGLMATGSSQRS